MPLTDFLRRWGGWLVVGLAAIGLIWWGQHYSTKPEVIRIATAKPGGYYYAFGEKLKAHIEKNTQYKVELLNSKGAVDNRSYLLTGKADLAILETGTITMKNLAAVSPLWNEYLQVIVRAGSGIKSVNDLKGKRVTIGRVGSGDRVNVSKVMDHYGIDLELLRDNDVSAGSLLKDEGMHAALLTTSPTHPTLSRIMATGRFDLLPVDAAQGLAWQYPYFTRTSVPAGVFTTPKGPLPAQAVPTITTMAILAASDSTDYAIVTDVLKTLFSLEFRTEVAGLIGKDQLAEHPDWALLNVHPASKAFFNPYQGAERISQLIEALDQSKWMLLFSLIIVVVGWRQWSQRSTVARELELNRETKRMEGWLHEISRLENAQRDARDMRLLREHLNDALALRKEMLSGKVGPHARGSNLYQAALMSSAYVVESIQNRMRASG